MGPEIASLQQQQQQQPLKQKNSNGLKTHFPLAAGGALPGTFLPLPRCWLLYYVRIYNK